MFHKDTSEDASSSIVPGQAGMADSSTGSGSGSTPMETFQFSSTEKESKREFYQDFYKNNYDENRSKHIKVTPFSPKLTLRPQSELKLLIVQTLAIFDEKKFNYVRITSRSLILLQFEQNLVCFYKSSMILDLNWVRTDILGQH